MDSYCVSRSSEVQIFEREPHGARLSLKDLYLIQARSAIFSSLRAFLVLLRISNSHLKSVGTMKLPP
jgi:hypothetical protein